MSEVHTYTEVKEQVDSPSPNGHQPVVPTRARSLPGQVNMVLLRPVQFYRTLRTARDTRQWVVIGLVILILVGVSAVRHSQKSNGETTTQTPEMGMEGGVPGDPFAPVDPGTVDPGMGAVDPGGSTEEDGAIWETALITASNYVAVWLILAVLLCNVSLIRGAAPRFDQNLQIAIWATLPLGLMAALQLLYFELGGKPGEPGISGLLSEWSGYQNLSNAEKDLLQSFAMRLTFFGLWALVLAYIGARQVLYGRRWASALIVVAWAALIIVLPVVLGTVKAPEVEVATEEMVPPGMEGMMPPGEGGMPEYGAGDYSEGGMPEYGEGGLGDYSEAGSGEYAEDYGETPPDGVQEGEGIEEEVAPESGEEEAAPPAPKPGPPKR